QVAELLAAQTGAWQHTSNCSFYYQVWRFSHQLANGSMLLTARVTGVRYIYFVRHLLTCYTQVFRVDHDHAIAAVGVRSEGWLVLATQNVGNLARYAA